MHAGSFFVNRRRRAQNGPAWRRFGGVEQNFIKIYVLISRPKKLWRMCGRETMIKRVWFLQHLCPKLGFTKNRVAYFDIGTLVMGHLGHYNETKLIFFQIFLFEIRFLKFFKFSRHADLRGFGVAACENLPAWRRPAAACTTGSRYAFKSFDLTK